MSQKDYAAHPAVAMEAKVIASLKEKTGRSLEEWVALILKSGPSGEKERQAWLKSEYQLGTNYAMWLAARAAGSPGGYDPDGLVEKMFAGKKAGLRPLYDRLLHLGYSLGPDVTATPCSTMVPLRRKFVFAHIKPPPTRASIWASPSARSPARAASSKPAATPRKTASPTASASPRWTRSIAS